MTRRVLVAGVGNIFLGDDGFGVEVVNRLARQPLPAGVRVADFGIRGVHLAYELLDGYDALILIDAAPRGEPPGTLSVIAHDVLTDNAVADDALADGQGSVNGAEALSTDQIGPAPVMDAHGMEPDMVLSLMKTLGGRIGAVWVLGCEPADVDDRMGLSPPVAAAVDRAVLLARELAESAAEPPIHKVL